MRYTLGMGADTTDGTGQRTETQVMQEMAEAAVRLTMLELELKRIRNPNGLTFADLRGILAGADVDTEDLDRARARTAAKLEAGV